MIPDRRLESLLVQAGAPVLCLDLAGRIRLGNPRALDALGYRHEELVGLDVFEIVSADDLDSRLLAGLASGRLGEFRLECRITRADGEIRRALCVAAVIRDAGGLPQSLLLILDDISRIKVAEATLQQHKLHDPITNLPAYALMRDRLEVALHAHQVSNSALAVLVTDLGTGTTLKDRLDALAIAVTQRIAARIRPTDTLARSALDQFIVMIPEVGGRASAIARARSMLAGLDDLAHVHAGFQPAIGIAIFPENGTEPECLIRRAELAMHLARVAGTRVGFVDAPPPSSAQTWRPLRNRNHRLPRRRRSESRALPLRSFLSIGLVATAFILGASSAGFGSVASLEGTRLVEHMVDNLLACERSFTECVVVSTSLPPSRVNPGPTAAETNPNAGQPEGSSTAVPMIHHQPPGPSRPTSSVSSPAPPRGGILGSSPAPYTGAAIPAMTASPSPRATPSPSPNATPSPSPSPRPTPSPSPRPTPSPSPRPTPSPSPRATPNASPGATLSATPRPAVPPSLGTSPVPVPHR